MDLTNSVFKSMNVKPDISFIDTPIDLRGRYQYFTEAEIHKLRNIGYTRPFTELETGVEQYVGEFLMAEACY
jgi:ADP-L-glycero-D-manno-heptose 6-epimerase